MTILEDVITYLEMLARPAGRRAPAPLEKLAVMRAEGCTVSFYRYLYDTVGAPWLWFERRLDRRRHTRRADREADDRDLCPLRARRSRGLLRARHAPHRARPSFAISASSPTSSAAGSAPTCCRRRSTAPGRGRSTDFGCTPRPSITQRRCASISRPALSSMRAAPCRSRIRASAGSCRAPSATGHCRPSTRVPRTSVAARSAGVIKGRGPSSSAAIIEGAYMGVPSKMPRVAC